MDYNKTLKYALDALVAAGAEKAQVELIVTEKHELNTEAGKVNLFRTNENATIMLKCIQNQKQGRLTLNKINPEAIDEGVNQIKGLVEASPVDEAYDIAEKVNDNFTMGILDPDLDGVYNNLKSLTKDMKNSYKQISGDAILSYDLKKRYILNTNGLEVSEVNGSYNFQVIFAAKDNERVTSMNYTMTSMVDLKKKLIEVGLLNELFDQTIKELDASPLGEKFVGDVIVTPHCLVDLLTAYSGIALMDGSIIGEKSKLKDKLNEKVASPKLHWFSNPRSVSVGSALTADGFVAEDMPIIEGGILKNHMLSQYGAKKTGRERSNNYGGHYVILPGEVHYDDMIKNIEKGILLCRFSGGNPSGDGTFSGIAKNSFLIENGKIVRPITETMISGNLFSLLEDIKGISKETMDSGQHHLPWIHSTNTTISG